MVLWRRNRLARADDPVDALSIERRIQRAGWELRYLNGAQTTGNALADTLLGVVEHHEAGEYLRNLSRDTLRGVSRRYRAGAVAGQQIPYGLAKQVVGRRR